MSLPLPPVKLIGQDATAAESVHAMLTSVIEGHPQATTAYTFYEEIDRWLGPWGESGYPIGYGKFYCIAFNSNAELMANPTTRDWVRKTTILLQSELRDYIVGRIRDGTAAAITEPEVRKAAFESHASVYTRAGLTLVALTAPELIPVISLIPRKEFDPDSPDFVPTVMQVFETAWLVGRQVPGSMLATLMPAHSGLLRNAIQADRMGLRHEEMTWQHLAALRDGIDRGEVDNPVMLQRVVMGLNATEYASRPLADLANEVVSAANRRLHRLRSYYDTLLKNSPQLREEFENRYGEIQ
jgi:hypothetical protein